MEVLGWIGSLLLAICAVPQAVQSFRQGHSQGVTHSLLWLWAGGEVFTLAYVLQRADWPLVVNYTANMVSLGVILWYKYKPRPTS